MNRLQYCFPMFLLCLGAGCKSPVRPDRIPAYDVVERPIAVDADVSDWQGVAAVSVKGAEHLWFGQGMTPDKWKGNADHSYQWRAAWSGNRLYFLFEVSDDRVVDPAQQPNSFLNDCIEIMIDPQNRGGARFEEADGKKTLHGYEMHFLPSTGQPVFVDDALSPMYPMSSPQNGLFREKWDGQTAVRKTQTGYIMEIAFSIPGVQLKPGLVLGLDTDTCDDDGQGRKSLQIWASGQVEFWLNMDRYGKVRLVD